MLFLWLLWARRPRRPMVIVEDPEDVGYRFVPDPLLDVLSAGEWRALEARAVRAAAADRAA